MKTLNVVRQAQQIEGRHSRMRRKAQARNPYSRWWLWIPGSTLARRPGMTSHPSCRFRLLGGERGEGLALGGEALEQRRRLERGIVGLLRIISQPVGDVLETDAVGPEHRAAAIDRPAVAVEPDHVDVARPRRDALVEDLR